MAIRTNLGSGSIGRSLAREKTAEANWRFELDEMARRLEKPYDLGKKLKISQGIYVLEQGLDCQYKQVRDQGQFGSICEATRQQR